MQRKKSEFPFFLLLFYLFFDYARPHQVFFPLLAKLHPGYILHILLIWYLHKEGKLLKFENPQIKAFFLLILLMMLHVPFAVNNYWAYFGWRNTVLRFIVFLSIISFVNTYEKLEKFTNLWIKIMIICAIIGIKSGGKIPYSGFMGDENDFALVMNMAIGFSYFMYFYEEITKRKMFYLISIILFLGAVVASFSRGGFVGLAGTIFYIWLRSPYKLKSTFILSIFAFLFFLITPPSYWKEMSTLKQEGLHRGTVGARWYSWKCGMKMFLDHPLFGVGQNNFPWNFEKYEPKEEWKRYRRRLHGGRTAHSLYVTVLCELGIVGTFLYFYIFYRSRKDLIPLFKYEAYYPELAKDPDVEKILRKLRYIAYAIECSLAGFFFSGTFLTVCYYPHYWIFNALMISTKNIADAVIAEKRKFLEKNESGKRSS